MNVHRAYLRLSGFYFHTPGHGWHIRVLCVCFQLCRFNRCLNSLTTHSWRLLMCGHQEGSKVDSPPPPRSWVRMALKASNTKPPLSKKVFSCQAGVRGQRGLRHWEPALWKCPQLLEKKKCIFLMFEPELWTCRSCHCFFNSKSVFPVKRQQCTSVQEAVVLGPICSRVAVRVLLFPHEAWEASPSARCCAPSNPVPAFL